MNNVGISYQYMKKSKKTFNQFLATLPKLKDINPQERLPYYFDLMWDIKYGHQLLEYLDTHNDPDIYSALARHGYDAKKYKKDSHEH